MALRFLFQKDRTAAVASGGDGVRINADELIQLRLKARSINLASQRPATSSTAGVHQSRFRGRGVDYQESRAYQPGDDIRNMDWRVTARSGRPHTKLYREERERPVITVVDLSPSMFFGTRVAFKSVVAARVAALIGWSTIRQGDRIGAFMFGQGMHHEIRPMGGRRGVLQLIRHLVAWTQPESKSLGGVRGGLGEALRRLRRVARPGSLVFILSDFYSLDDATEPHLSRLRQHNDIVACQILDTLDLAPPPPDRYGITDGRNAGILDTRNRAMRTRYKAYCAQHQAVVKGLMSKHAVALLLLTTQDDVAEGLRLGLASAGTQRP